MAPADATRRDPASPPDRHRPRWALRVGRFWAIDVYVHATFALLLAWFGTMEWQRTGTVEGVARGLALVLAVFGCVVLHEYGHALMARRFGVKTRDITLYPIGGIARLERFPERPGQEFLIAIAGPAVNLLIAGGLYAVLVLGPGSPTAALDFEHGSFVAQLFVVNLYVGAFNMVPAFPMDGGRVLRAILALSMGYLRATRVAASIGKLGAVLLGILGLLTNPVLLLIALFVWFAAGQEATAVQMKAYVTGVPVHALMVREFSSLPAGATLGNALERLLATNQQDFPVADGNEVVGVVRRKVLLEALERHGESAPISVAMEEPESPVEAYDSATDALARLQTGTPLIPVVQRERLVGLLTAENLAEYLAAAQALERHHQHDAAPARNRRE